MINYGLLIRTIFDKYNNTIFNVLRQHVSDTKYWNYIPSHFKEIEVVLQDIICNDYKGSVIDVGCGSPVIPTLFKILGYKSYGLEYNELYKLAYNSLGEKVLDDYIIGDLLTHDFKEYDILYSYNPIRDKLLMLEGIKNIIKTMKPGAVFYFKEASVEYSDLRKLGFTLIPTSYISKYIKK